MAGILGMTITKISAEKKKNAAGPTEITTQPSIIDVAEIKLSGIAADLSALNIGFALNSSFRPDTGSISIEGAILYKSDEPENIIKEWKNSKSLPPQDSAIILNHVLSKVSIIGLYISDLLQLPPIVGLPKVELKRNNNTAPAAAPPTQEKKKSKS